MGLGNPVPGIIQAKQEVWKGTPTFRVTKDYADHVALGQTGIDFGNGRGGDPVLAVDDGEIVRLLTDPNGSLIVRQRTNHLVGGIVGYAHVARWIVRENQMVTRGQTIAYVGKTGATANHLHFGLTINGRPNDPWKYLDQNLGGTLPDTGTGAEPMITILSFPDGFHTINIPAGATVDGWEATGTAPKIRRTWATATSFPADCKVQIDQTPNRPPEGLFYHCTAGVYAGLYVPVPQVVDGGPQAGDVKAAQHAAASAVSDAADAAAAKFPP